jgi:hypothetical protein
MNLPKIWDKPKPQAAPVVQASKTNPAVTATQISDSNAGQMAGALAKEIDQDASPSGIQQAGAATSQGAPCSH